MEKIRPDVLRRLTLFLSYDSGRGLTIGDSPTTLQEVPRPAEGWYNAGIPETLQERT